MFLISVLSAVRYYVSQPTSLYICIDVIVIGNGIIVFVGTFFAVCYNSNRAQRSHICIVTY